MKVREEVAQNASSVDDDSPALRSGAGRIAGLAVQMFGLARFNGEAPSSAYQTGRTSLKYLVVRHCDRAFEAFVFEKVEDVGGRKSAVEPHPQSRPGNGHAQVRQQPRAGAERADRGADIAGAQYIREQVLYGFPVESQKTRHRHQVSK